MFGAFESVSFLVHVGTSNGRTVEELLSPRSPTASAPAVAGAVVDATYVNSDPALLPRLAQAQIPWVTEPQSHRFASERFRSTAALAALPYAPQNALDPARSSRELEAMVRGALEFQAQHEPGMYMVPSLPLTRVSNRVLAVYQRIHELAVEINNSSTIPYRPLLASAYPGITVMRGRFSVFDRLDPRHYAGAYVQALTLNARRDSLEKLMSYASFLEEGQMSGLPVIAGRPGTFGLVLAAFGIDQFDSALGDGESFSLARLEYERERNEKGRRKGGHRRRIYFAQLLGTVDEDDADWIVENRAIRAQMGCDIGECRYGGHRFALEHPRDHFFHTRVAELEELKQQGTTSLRVTHMARRLEAAIESGQLVNRLRRESGKDDLDLRYLDRWLSVLARVATVVAVR